MNDIEIADIIADHQEMIMNALDEGLPEADIKKKFGDPFRVAEELAQVNTTRQQPDTKGNLWKSYPVIDQIEMIDIDLENEDIEYLGGMPGENLEIYYEGKFHPEYYTIDYSANNLKIKSEKHKSIGFFPRFHDDLRFIIKVPDSCEVGELVNKVINSDITLKNIKTRINRINTTNGDIEIENSDLGQAKWHTVNGDFEIAHCEAESIEITSVNGDVDINGFKVKTKFSVESVNGDFDITDVECNEFVYDSVSGDLLGKELYGKKMDFRTVSGDVDINNKNHPKENVIKYSTTSGDINLN